MNRSSNTADAKRMVEQGYDQVAQDYARLEGVAEWPRMRWLNRMNSSSANTPNISLGAFHMQHRSIFLA
jgi:hypothetical protein